MPLHSTWPNPVAVESSLLANVSYDEPRAILTVEFRAGAVYRYTNVPLQIFQDLLQAGSKGAYFNHHIRGLHPYSMLQHARPRPAEHNDDSEG
jgi:KTSC domain